MLRDFAQPKAAQLRGEAGLGVGGVRQRRAQDLLNRAADHLVKSFRVVFPLGQRRCAHVVHCSHDAEAHSQQEGGRLGVLEIGEARRVCVCVCVCVMRL